MKPINFELTKRYIYNQCVLRVETKRKSEIPIKPQIALCRDDKSLVSNFFNCNLTSNNPYLVTKRLLNYPDDTPYNKGIEKTGAVPVFGFKDEHEVLWGNNEEFIKNLYTIFSLLIKDILNSEYIGKDIIHNTLCDNIVYSKYYTFKKIKETHNVSLLETFGIYDFFVNNESMAKYLDIAIEHTFMQKGVKDNFYTIFMSYTRKHNDFTHIDKRLHKEFLPLFIKLFEQHSPTTSSLGIRVKTLIETDIIKAIDQINALSTNSDFVTTPEFELNKKIIHASSQYICELEDIAHNLHKSGITIQRW